MRRMKAFIFVMAMVIFAVVTPDCLEQKGGTMPDAVGVIHSQGGVE